MKAYAWLAFHAEPKTMERDRMLAPLSPRSITRLLRVSRYPQLQGTGTHLLLGRRVTPRDHACNTTLAKSFVEKTIVRFPDAQFHVLQRAGPFDVNSHVNTVVTMYGDAIIYLTG